MALVDTVGAYIDANIFHSGVWDEADVTQRTKAVNNCVALLTATLPKYFPTVDDIEDDILANQVVWFMRIDDTFLRAEMGATYIQMSGVMVNIKDRDRSISPYVLDRLGISADAITGGVTKRKVGSYSHRVIGTPFSTLRNENDSYPVNRP